MGWFVIPLLIGFAFNSLSAFTAFYSNRLGIRAGRRVCFILRNILGIPLWAIGYALAILTKAAYIFVPTILSGSLAWLLILAGVILIIVGLLSLRWRAVIPSVNDTLIVTGLYAHIRHPLYSGMLLELAGLFFWCPTLPVFVACMIGVLWVFLQTRLEEWDLVQRLPAYQEYMQRVPRFLPRFK
jgi:protein-S-isoprenylcysteine O-methyltransferase Ste14